MSRKYDGEQHLMNNQEYTLSIKLSNKTHTFKFTSKYSPLYSTSKIIKNDLLDIVESIDDDVINFTIWQNSILANEVANTEIKDGKIPFYAKQWVRYKTEIDLVYAVYLAISGKSGSVSKKLGNMLIEKRYKIPFLKDMLSELKKKLGPFDKQLTGVKVVGRSVLKAGKTPYPLTQRRSF